MQRTLILVVTHRGIAHETGESIGRLNCPSIIKLAGLGNLPKARSMAFDSALEAIEGTAIDTVLCIDDDIVFPPEAARELVSRSRVSGELTSAIYVNRDGAVAARPLRSLVVVPGKTRWLAGMGCLAVPVAQLKRVADQLPRVGELREWCQTGAHRDFPGEWLGEDFWFCAHFGGAELAPIPVGHLKTIPLWPDERTVQQIAKHQAETQPGVIKIPK